MTLNYKPEYHDRAKSMDCFKTEILFKNSRILVEGFRQNNQIIYSSHENNTSIQTRLCVESDQNTILVFSDRRQRR